MPFNIDAFICTKEDQYTHTSYNGRKGLFKIDNLDDLDRFNDFILTNRLAKRYTFVEMKTPYYKLIIDLDFKDDDRFKAVSRFDVNKLTDSIMSAFIETLGYFVEDSELYDKYIYSDKSEGNGVHIYFPELIVNNNFARAVRSHVIECLLRDKKYKEIDQETWKNIIDGSLYYGTGMKLMFQTVKKAYYKVNPEKSTLKGLSTERKHLLELTRIRTPSTSYNFTPKTNKKGKALYTFYLD